MTFVEAIRRAIDDPDTRRGSTDRERVVLSDGSNAWTGPTVLTRVAAIADELRSRTSPGQRLLLVLPSGAPLIAAFLAAGEASLVPVVLDASSSDQVVRDVVDRLRPAAVLTDRGTTWRATADPARDPAPTGPGAEVSPAFVVMTSGTTNAAKGVRRTHDSWLRSFAATPSIAPGPGDRVAVPGPLASSWFLYAAIEGLCAGAAVRVWEHVDPARIVDELDAWQASHVTVVPTLLDDCVRSARRRGLVLPSVQRITSCGGIWPAGLRARSAEVAPNARIGDVYGAAEWSVVSLREIDEGSDDGSVGGDLGRPVAGVEIAVRDDDHQPVADGAAGVLWVRSQLTFDGYVPTTTDGETGDDVTCDDDGFVAVGDVVRYVDGRLQLVGRRDHALSSRGSKVHPEPIEAVLRELAEVVDAAVTLASDDRRGEHLVALVQRATEVTSGQLRVHVRRRLPRASRPARYLDVVELPRTGAGKLDRRQLPGLAATARPLRTAVAATTAHP